MAVEDWKGKRKAESETTLMSYQGEERHILNRCIKACGTPTNLSTVRYSSSKLRTFRLRQLLGR